MKSLRLTDWIVWATRGVLLLLVVLVLTGVLFVVSTGRPEPVEPSPESMRPVELYLPAMGAPPDGAMVSRPLFWASRSPVSPPEAVEEDVQVSRGSILDNMKIVGLLGADENAVAIVQIGQQRRRIQLNEVVEGWELTSISPNGATFTGSSVTGTVAERTLPLARVDTGSRIADDRERLTPETPEESQQAEEEKD